MTNQQWPPPEQSGQSPWAQPDPHWHPSEFRDAQGRDPRTPFGQKPEQVQPANFEPPKRSRPALFTVLGGVVVVAAILIGMQVFGGPTSPNSALPSSSTSPTSPSASRSGTWIPFEGNGDGIFELVSSQWRDGGLLVTIRVEVSRGEYNFGMFAFTDSSRESFEPSEGTRISASVNAPFEGSFFFAGMPQADSTLMLTTSSGTTLLNALPING